MTPSELRTISNTLNPGGQTKLARILRVNPRTVRRWLAGKSRIPPAVAILLGDCRFATHQTAGLCRTRK
jgi:hypothetical protein